MESMTANEMKSLMRILKEPAADYNARSLGMAEGITPMGALKILKKMGGKNLLVGKKYGKAIYYKPNLSEEYPEKFYEFLLRKEAEEASPRTRAWVREIRKLSGRAEAAIIFGSVLGKKEYNDVDVLFVLSQGQLKALKEEIAGIDSITDKKIHPIMQTKEDLVRNIRGGDKVVLSALKNGVVAFGYEKVIEAIRDSLGLKSSTNRGDRQ